MVGVVNIYRGQWVNISFDIEFQVDMLNSVHSDRR